MPITLQPIEDGHVLLYTFAEEWQVHDLNVLYPKANIHIEHAPYRVHSLADLRASKTRVPQGILRARNGAVFSHSNNGYVVVVGAFGLARTIADTIFRLVNFKQARFFENMDEAMAFLRGAIADEQNNPEAPMSGA